jgi:recombination protein RecT
MNENLKSALNLVQFMGGEKNLKAYEGAVKQVVPSRLKAEVNQYWAMYSQILKGFINNPKVTDKKTIIKCLFNAPKLGLNPDPIFGQIYFIPYNGKLTYQIGYKGYVVLACDAGFRVRANLVYEKDVELGGWKYYEDEKGQHYYFEPALKEKDRGKLICAYSCFSDSNGIEQIHVMDAYHINDIEKLVLARMGQSDTPWKNPLFKPEMQKKTCIRRHQKTEPISYQMAKVVDHEETNERGDVVTDEFEELSGVDESNIGDISTEDGKKLNAELDAMAAEESRQQALPFK